MKGVLCIGAVASDQVFPIPAMMGKTYTTPRQPRKQFLASYQVLLPAFLLHPLIERPWPRPWPRLRAY